jgi:hypothetical protein
MIAVPAPVNVIELGLTDKDGACARAMAIDTLAVAVCAVTVSVTTHLATPDTPVPCARLPAVNVVDAALDELIVMPVPPLKKLQAYV